MTKEQKDKVEEALIKFIVKATNEDETTPEAITALPNVVSALAQFDEINPSCH